MKVGIVSESPADEAVIKILIEKITRRRIEVASSARVRAGGWPSMLHALDVEYKRLHYHTDAHAIIAVADSDDSPLHTDDHDQLSGGDEECRFCLMAGRLNRASSSVGRRPAGDQVQYAIGVAVPALEAWLLCGTDPRCREARFMRDLQEGRPLVPIRRELKKALYGTITPSLLAEAEIATRAAERLAHDLSILETHFPVGFKRFAQKLRAL